MTDDERMLVNHCRELYKRAGNAVPSFSRYLSPREQYILKAFGLLPPLSVDTLADNDALGFLWGGFDGAERAVYCALPSYYAYSLGDTANETGGSVEYTAYSDNDAAYAAQSGRSISGGSDDTTDATPVSLQSRFPVSIESKLAAAATDELEKIIQVLRIDAGGFARLTHRDYLGSITALGIDRSKLGDILVDDGGAYLFCSEAAAELILYELRTIGRDGVKVKKATLPDDFIYNRSFADESGTIASPRLDAIVSELAHVSRERAKELISRGLVEQNYFAAASPDAEISEGDVITVKRDSGVRNGKFILDSLSPSRRSGRLVVHARRYQ